MRDELSSITKICHTAIINDGPQDVGSCATLVANIWNAKFTVGVAIDDESGVVLCASKN